MRLMVRICSARSGRFGGDDGGRPGRRHPGPEPGPPRAGPGFDRGDCLPVGPPCPGPTVAPRLRPGVTRSPSSPGRPARTPPNSRGHGTGD